ncbi:MAG: hypothetical protein KatS3mg005_4126 [Bryobacteraceae bacterium]|nr:MAG: hypothetical protein KatS3mg005_4126 [Bryobacteraceae bacterium]
MTNRRFQLQLGAEPRKVAILIALLAAAAYFFYQNLSEGQPAAGPSRPRSAAVSGPAAAPSPAAGAPSRSAAAVRREFRPSLLPRKDEDRSRIDPTLRLDLLAKLETVKFDSAGRNLFEFGPVEAPKPKLPEPKIEIRNEPKFIGPELPPPPPAPPVKQPPPPIPLKFYGLALPLRGDDKRVFCLQGDDILTPSEGDLVQNRYRIVRITPTAVLVEDIEHKHQQQIPIDQPPPGG